MTESTQRHYKATESKYKGRAKEMYVTYDRWQHTRGENEALYPKVKRVYIAGEITNWKVGTFKKRTGKAVYGVKIDYEQSRAGYSRKGYTAHRSGTEYQVSPARIHGGKSNFSQIVEVPKDAQNVKFQPDELPPKYKEALQAVR
jgi:hypothetical protein